MPFLEELDLGNNPILAVGAPDVGLVAGAFAAENNVRKLTISESNVTTLARNSFTQLRLRSLTHLTLESNVLTAIGINSFAPLINLVESGLTMASIEYNGSIVTSSCFYSDARRGVQCDCADGFYPGSGVANHPYVECPPPPFFFALLSFHVVSSSRALQEERSQL
jgi:hypothetical protein